MTRKHLHPDPGRPPAGRKRGAGREASLVASPAPMPSCRKEGCGGLSSGSSCLLPSSTRTPTKRPFIDSRLVSLLAFCYSFFFVLFCLHFCFANRFLLSDFSRFRHRTTFSVLSFASLLLLLLLLLLLSGASAGHALPPWL